MNTITPSIITQFETIVGAEYVLTDHENVEKYGRDETEKLF